MHVLGDWLLTPECVAVHLPTRTAVVADLHLGYAEARRRRGDAVPREPVAEQLRPLRRVRQQYAIRKLVVAGDLLEDGNCCEALAAFRKWLDCNALELAAVVPGNHDLTAEASLIEKAGMPVSPQGVDLGEWRIVHGAGPLPNAPVVHGHFHPCLRWSPKRRANRPRFARGRFAPNVLDGPCYLSGPGRLILPAFSQEAAGVNVLPVRCWQTLRCHAVAGRRVLDLGQVAVLRRRLTADF